MPIRSTAVAAALLLLARVGAAQSVGNMLKDDFKYAFKDIGAVWIAPFDASGKDWAIAAASGAAVGLSMFGDQAASDWAIDVSDTWFFEKPLKPLRRGGWLFAGKYVVPPVAAMYIIGIATKNQGMRDWVMGCVASYGAQFPPRKAIYRILGRARPDTMPDNPQHWDIGSGHSSWQMRSFPAGHFANIMSCASFTNNRFKLGVAEPVIFAIAAGVGVGRMADEAHWLSDSVFGGVLGYAIGKEVARRSLDRHEARKGGPAVNVSPAPGGLSVNLNWTF